MESPQLVGTLLATQVRGKEIFSFSYSKLWLKQTQSKILDPDLQWYEGPQFLRDEKPNFGIFMDSSPDRWGRTLMKRREAILAKITAKYYKLTVDDAKSYISSFKKLVRTWRSIAAHYIKREQDYMAGAFESSAG